MSIFRRLFRREVSGSVAVLRNKAANTSDAEAQISPAGSKVGASDVEILHEVIECGQCAQKLRVPTGLKRIKVTCPKCKSSWEYEPMLGSRCANQPQEQLAEAIRRAYFSTIPESWTAFRLSSLNLEVPYPASWAIGVAPEWVMIRPTGGTALVDSGNTYFNPGFTIRAHGAGNTDELLLKELERSWKNGAHGAKVLDLERLSIGGTFVLAVRYQQSRPSGLWTTLLTSRVKRDAYVDVSVEGLPAVIDRMLPDLLPVLANVRWYESSDAFAEAGSRRYPDLIYDTLPEGNAIGVLFEINSANNVEYGDQFEAEFRNRLDMKKLRGAEIKVGDILPDCRYYCIRVDGSAEVIAYIRRSLGSVSNSAHLACPPYRFMSGTNLVRAPLVFKGIVDTSGRVN